VPVPARRVHADQSRVEAVLYVRRSEGHVRLTYSQAAAHLGIKIGTLRSMVAR